MDKFERNSGLFCPHSPLCALKSIPPPAARSPTVAPRGQPTRSWNGLWRGGEWPWRRAAIARARLQPAHGQAAKAYLLARETYGFAARKHTFCLAKPYLLPRPLRAVRSALATHHTTAESSPAPDETGQNGLPSPLRHTPTWRGSAGDSALSAPAMRPRLIIKAAAGHASRPSARDLGGGAEERWNGRFLAKSALPSLIPEGAGARRKWLGAGASAIGLQRCGHAHCGKPQARASLIQNKRYNNTKRPRRQATSLRQRRPCGRREECPGGARKLRETRRGDGIASRDTVPPDTLIIKTYAKPK